MNTHAPKRHVYYENYGFNFIIEWRYAQSGIYIYIYIYIPILYKYVHVRELVTRVIPFLCNYCCLNEKQSRQINSAYDKVVSMSDLSTVCPAITMYYIRFYNT